MGAFNPTEGMKVDDEELKKALGSKGSADSDEGEEGDEDAGGGEQTVGSRYAAIADRLGAASLPDRGGAAAKYVGPAPGPMQSKPQLASALSMMGPKPTMPPSPSASTSKEEDGEEDSPSSIPMLTKDQLDSARDEKARLGMWGALADNLSNRQSFGNFFLGKMNPHQDASAAFRQQQGLVDQGIKDTQTLQQQALKAPEMQYMADLQKPDSDASNAKREEAKMGINALVQAKLLDPEKAQGLMGSLENMNGFQAGKMMEGNPLLKQAADVMKSQAQLAMNQRRLDQGDQRLTLAQGNQALAAGKQVTGDSNVMTLVKQSQAIDRGMHTLSTVEKVTPQLLSEVQLDIANAISGGKAAAVSTQEKTEFESINTKMANLMQKLRNRPEDIDSPEVKQYLMDVMGRLKEAYARNLDTRKRQVGAGMENIPNPMLQNVVRDKLATLGGSDTPEPQPSGFGVPGVSSAMAGGGFSDMDRKAYEAANHDLNDPNVDQATKTKALNVILNLSKKKSGGH